jgi:hypothetical protein
MNVFRLMVLLVLAGALAGCGSVSERFAERFDSAAPQMRAIAADRQTVFFAAQKALKRMDFVLTRTAAAQGIVNAQSSIRDTAVFGAGRQFTFEIKVHGADATSTNVDARLTELLEGDFKAGATGKTLRAHGLYDSFYEQLERAVREAGTAAKPAA